jgi:hypothetical protein
MVATATTTRKAQRIMTEVTDIRAPLKLPWPPSRQEGAQATKEEWQHMIRACNHEQLDYVLDHFLEASARANACLIMSHDTLQEEARHLQDTITRMYLAAGEYIAERVQAQLAKERTDIWNKARAEVLKEMERELDKSRP